MRYLNVSIQDLNPKDVALWNSYAAPDGQLISPYLHLDFIKAVDAVRDDVRVLIAEQDHKPLAFLPYHAPKRGIARPIAAPMSDYHGLIAHPDFHADPQDILNAIGASALVFNNWVGAQPSQGVKAKVGSSVIDLSQGAEAYFDQQRSLYKDHFKKIKRRLNKAERELGPARLQLGDGKGYLFETLKHWKSHQYRETGKLDLLNIDWVDNLLNTLAQKRLGELRGLTSALYFGDHLAAIEFGLIAGDVYHSWFPAYDPSYAKTSPGLVLMHKLIEALQPRLGVNRIDLGKGDSAYKKYYTSYEVPLMEGRFLAPGLAAARVAGMEWAETLAAPLPPLISKGVSKLRGRWAHTAAFEARLDKRLALMSGAFGHQFGLTGT